jgi:hypothetical protein
LRVLPTVPTPSPTNRADDSWADDPVVGGSLRQRSEGSWELRVYIGVDPETGRRIDRSMALRGSRADAERELDAMVAAVEATRAVGVPSTVSELLEAWFAVAQAGWAPTTIRQTRSVLDRYLHPHLGETKVGDVMPAAIDSAYAHLHRRGGRSGQPLALGTLARIHVVLRSAFSQCVRWAGSGTTPPNAPTASPQPPTGTPQLGHEAPAQPTRPTVDTHAGLDIRPDDDLCVR